MQRRPFLLVCRSIGIAILAAGLFAMIFAAEPESSSPQSPIPLKALVPPGFSFGGVLYTDTDPPWRDGKYFDPDYADLAAAEFNAVTIPASLSMSTWVDSQASINAESFSNAVNWAHAHSMCVHGHALVYPSYSTELEWWNQLPNEQVEDALCKYVESMVGQEERRVRVWNVVNEPFASAEEMSDRRIADDDGIAKGVWVNSDDASSKPEFKPFKEYEAMQQTYIEKAFRWANKADDNAKLILNEFDCEEIVDRNGVFNIKRDKLLKFCKKLQAAKVPIHGVGFQMHFHDASKEPNYESIQKNFREFGALGLQVYVTEIDVAAMRTMDANERPTAEMLDRQRRIYQSILKIALEEAACVSFMMWDFADDRSWQHPNKRSEHTFPAVFRSVELKDSTGRLASRKPAYFGIHEELSNFRGKYNLFSGWELKTGQLIDLPSDDGESLQTSTAPRLREAHLSHPGVNWHFERIQGSTYRIHCPWGDNGYLAQDPTSTIYVQGKVVTTAFDATSEEQTWVLESITDGGGRLKNAWSGKYLTRREGNNVGQPSDGVCVHPLNTAWSSQVWYFHQELD